MYSTTTSVNHNYPEHTPYGTVIHNPLVHSLAHSSHDVDPYGDAIVSYGVDEFGEPVRIVSTGILHGHEIMTYAERVAPGETITTNHISTNYLNDFEAEENLITNTDIVSPSQYVKTTTYSPSRVRPIHYDFAPIDAPVTNSITTTTTRHVGSPYRHVTTYHSDPYDPHH